MWKRRLCATCAMLLAGVLWAACSGDAYVGVEREPTCGSTEECDPDRTGTQCIDGLCRCADPAEESCCEPGAIEKDGDLCRRQCRPNSECNAALCETPRDCPKPVDPRCGEAVCVDGVCWLALPEQLPNQRRGDCMILRCDESGRLVAEPDDSDVFNDGNECTVDACAQGASVHSPKASGNAEEGSGYCDGEGHRVGCLRDEDCGTPSYACSMSGRCVLEWCGNGIFDNASGETARDCGGPCEPCRAGQPCMVNSDCIEGVCGPDMLCEHADCHDRIQNGAETDVDCGAPSCPACDSGLRCNAHAACKSGVCGDGTCLDPTCDDGVQNGDEAGIDCGTTCPIACPLLISGKET
ncbi:hypothetical protein BE20_17650 [Sorangium cellulosum]|uniref:Tryptophan synthase alpha chain n=1 Tax=Sorangium cellulosum TaxID=56 RepID=A0A150SD96_SORCE|nr:hypothetical protein BE20_17650 [Sorangium cellulosum]KYF98884.1 hypothetical protein BE18_16370 [Sorangium cellulosum]